MTLDRNPQAQQMGHESMQRNLAAQAEALWPQEREVILRNQPPDEARVLDVGCGTGEAVLRLAELLPAAAILGIDVYEPHIELARQRCASLGERIEFRVGDAFELDLADDSFDLVVCRHVLQAIPHPERVLAELARVTRPGGRVHTVAEDYAMIHFHPTAVDVDRFFLEGPCEYARKTGSDLRSGRAVPGLMRELGLDEVRVDYAVLDTERVSRDALARIFAAWRDGYAESVAAHSALTIEDVHRAFTSMLDCLADPNGYAVWQLPIVTARVST